MSKISVEVPRPVRLQVSISEEIDTLVDELVRMTGLSRSYVGAVALTTGARIMAESIRQAMTGIPPEEIAPELAAKVQRDLDRLAK